MSLGQGKLCMAVQSFPGANDILRRHWSYFERAGCDELIGIGTSNGSTWFPQGIRTELIGADLYIQGSHLPSRLIRTFEHLMLLNSDWLAVAEYDVVFYKAIDRNLPHGLTTHLAGGKPEGAYCNVFYHGPYICDRDTAMRIIRFGNELLATKKHDASPDLFLGHVCELAEIPVHTEILGSYSRNTIHLGPWAEEARQARLAGGTCCHGVKDAAVLREILREND